MSLFAKDIGIDLGTATVLVPLWWRWIKILVNC